MQSQTLENLTDDYKVALDVFEGPLDLLLYLIRREELDIYDIPIERITRQYLDYLELMRRLDLSVAGEFLVMASTLMMIKSRMLLPVESRAATEDEDEEWVDPRLDLVRQLVEYKKFKDSAYNLMRREALRSECFAYGGEIVVERERPEVGQLLGDVGLFDLLSAFQEVLNRTAVVPLGHLEPIRWTIPDKMRQIIAQVQARAAMRFSSIFPENAQRGEVIVTFIALLELLRLRHVNATQDATFKEIVIEPIPESVPDSHLPLPDFSTEWQS